MANHVRRLVRTGMRPLAQRTRRLLTGAVVNFNRKHTRTDHLVQNRYKSIVVEKYLKPL